MELTPLIDWFGTLSGVFGVVAAIYLQLINVRRCHPLHVMGLFVAGSALVLTFSAAWSANVEAIAAMKVAAIVLFTGLEVFTAYVIWKRAEVAPPSETIRTLFFKDENGGSA